MPTEGEDLIADILLTHHARLWRELPAIDKELCQPGHPPALRAAWRRFSRFMDGHAAKEEAVLFPNLMALFAGQDVHGRPIEGPIAVLGMEHREIDALIDELRPLCGADPLGAQIRALLDDTLVHAAKEDELLFPAVRARLQG